MNRLNPWGAALALSCGLATLLGLGTLAYAGRAGAAPAPVRPGGTHAATLRAVHRLSTTTEPGPTVPGTEYVTDYQYRYTADPLEALTAHWYSGRSGAPGILLIHGGSWTNGSRAYMQAESDLFYSRGWQVFNMEYRRGDGVTWADQMQDLRAARDWLTNGYHESQFHLSPGRLAVFGFSAGGHMAAMLANDGPGFTAVVEESGVLQPQRFPLAVEAGSTDGEVGYIYARERSLLGCAYSTDLSTACGQAWHDFEPEHGLDSSTPASYVMYGEADPLFCDDAAKSFYYWLGYHGVAPRVLVGVPGLGHTNQVLLGSEDRIHALLVWLIAQWSA